MMTREQMKAELERIENRIWMIEMADYIRGQERVEYENLKCQRNELKRALANR